MQILEEIKDVGGYLTDSGVKVEMNTLSKKVYSYAFNSPLDLRKTKESFIAEIAEKLGEEVCEVLAIMESFERDSLIRFLGDKPLEGFKNSYTKMSKLKNTWKFGQQPTVETKAKIIDTHVGCFNWPHCSIQGCGSNF